MRYTLTAFLALILGGASCTAAEGPRIGADKKIIKTGQDMPDARCLRGHIREMERYPFDGVTIDLSVEEGGKRERLAYRWWAPEEMAREQVRDSIDDLLAVEFRRFTDNFLWISTQSQPLPAPSWLDDEGFARIKANMVLAATIARECGLKGVFLDVEQYGGMKWSRWMMRFCYPYAHASEMGMVTRKLVDRVVPYEEYVAAARRRGREIMSAMCEEYPEITVLVLPGIHSVAKERIGYGARYCPEEKLEGLASSDYGILAAFGDGMLEGMSPEATLVDGHEKSYAYTLDARFVEGRRGIEEAVDVSAVGELYRQRMKTGFGLMLDNRYNVRGGWHVKEDEFIHNHFTPAEFGNALYFGMLRSDRYVWIWNELRGAVFFDSPAREGERKANVPEGYVLAMRNARNAREMDAGRDSRCALAQPVPPSASEARGYSDEATFGPLADAYEIVGDLPKEWLFLADEEALGIGYYTAEDWDETGWKPIRTGEYFQRQGYRFRGIAWYRCRFDVPRELEGKGVCLLFGGVGTNHFFVNGQWLSERSQKNGVWVVDFTKVARFGEKNLIVLGIVTTGSPGGVYKSVKLAVKK
ncbi:MAG: hypothetical protein V2A58_13180 [Planctomycetota bacterium]